ncbi:DMT family transporter [Ponticoccus sp. SC2-23]|nr:DMT family transporter [Ponticoccus sp. SC6-9]MBM1224995.1 DMT family transporter [Ponticoccus sp. SC6-15]MBM1228509.1 DMT family transporter [Ponticoccus sp. SC6-38]MBM1233854.1 DMT family transporter [Ponticoccus sp. SC6-45]MBM1239010.1 DMT family transporter [Ponticoccus sp. SC6-49]MBM1242792.1 DMT family transporter [Ponticoccus sp. SC2-64]MBM1247378.1 DMT family transporter [Ponticoccus sp. SC6-42]MBM1251963.1 DMT family transporter [Ponticoccus sp. SC6-33]MBM1257019.1 DMT family tr
MDADQLRGHLAMLLFSALVAGSFSLGAMAANEIAPSALNAIRFWLAAVIIAAAVMATGGVPRGAFSAPWRYLVLGGVFGTYFVLMFEGLKTAQPVSAAAVFTLTPLMTALFGWFLLRQRLTGRMALALVIGAIGATWVIFRADLSAMLRFDVGRGEAVYFIGCVSHAIYTPLVRLLNRGESALIFTFGTMLGGAVLVSIWGFPAILATDWLNLPLIVWITIFYVTVFASAATFVLIQYAALRLPSAKVMAYTYLTPSWVILIELGLGRGAPPLLVSLGFATTLVSLVLLLRDDG